MIPPRFTNRITPNYKGCLRSCPQIVQLSKLDLPITIVVNKSEFLMKMVQNFPSFSQEPKERRKNSLKKKEHHP
jgi:hypothetical protein